MLISWNRQLFVIHGTVTDWAPQWLRWWRQCSLPLAPDWVLLLISAPRRSDYKRPCLFISSFQPIFPVPDRYSPVLSGPSGSRRTFKTQILCPSLSRHTHTHTYSHTPASSELMSEHLRQVVESRDCLSYPPVADCLCLFIPVALSKTLHTSFTIHNSLILPLINPAITPGNSVRHVISAFFVFTPRTHTHTHTFIDNRRGRLAAIMSVKQTIICSGKIARSSGKWTKFVRYEVWEKKVTRHISRM